MTKLLIIDDDQELSQMLSEYLRPEGFDVTSIYRGDEGADWAIKEGWDVIILDIMLPGLNGIEVLRAIRQQSAVPVLMLTAKGEDIDRILGLEMGADDYLPKPFNPRELVARLRAILRRQPSKHSPTSNRQPEQYFCRSLSLTPTARKAAINGKPLEVTSTEFNVLEALIENAGQVVSKEQLYKKALGRHLAPYDRSIDMHISHLRRKLTEADKQLIIHTIRGTGYQLEK